MSMVKYVYRLFFQQAEDDEYYYGLKALGTYSSVTEVQKAIQRYKKRDSFIDLPLEYFFIKVVVIDKMTEWINGFTAVPEQISNENATDTIGGWRADPNLMTEYEAIRHHLEKNND